MLLAGADSTGMCIKDSGSFFPLLLLLALLGLIAPAAAAPEIADPEELADNGLCNNPWFNIND